MDVRSRRYMMKALEVAKYIVNRSIDENKPISNLQLQKILYFSHIDVLKATNEKLVDGQFEAWDYGPVLPDVYNEFSPYGANKLTIKEDVSENLDKEIKDIVDKSIDECIKKAPWELVKESHQKGSPWHKAYKKGEKNIISDNDIEDEAKSVK